MRAIRVKNTTKDCSCVEIGKLEISSDKNNPKIEICQREEEKKAWVSYFESQSLNEWVQNK